MNSRRLHSKPLALAAVLLALCSNVRAQQAAATPSQTTADAARVERLVGLAKVWGAVKYFHPYLAYREIDWDKALVETIPKVQAAKTTQEYQAALNQMLAALGDPSTRAEIEVEARAAPTDQAPASAKEPVRTEEG